MFGQGRNWQRMVECTVRMKRVEVTVSWLVLLLKQQLWWEDVKMNF